MPTQPRLKYTFGALVALALLTAGSETRAQRCSGQVMAEKQSCSPHVTILPGGCALPSGCDPSNPLTFGNCTGISACNCSTLPGMMVWTASDGSQFCVPEKTPKNCPGIPIGNPLFADPHCNVLPITPKRSIDPNDKVGTVGVLDQQFIGAGVPLNYAIHFENLSTATAPAQVVVVTDQLDVQRMDLATLQFGPITFGAVTLVPEPGAQTFTGGVDLGLEQDLQVTVTAALDKSTGLVTWRFTTIDGATGQLTDDPDAGFLPPNVNPPAGEGSVVFSVMPKSGLATGTAIRNQAQVVFDTNAPIATPTWLNSIDRDAPVTRVLPLSTTQSVTTFPVQWTGSDAGAGIRDFSIYVSDNGGAFTLWQDHTAALSANFTGAIGHTYGFFAVGTDLVGNVEPVKSAADATTQIANAPVCAADVSAQVQVTRSGFSYNFASQRFVQTVTLKNVSGITLGAPISLVIDGLGSNATLYSPTGTTACATPAGSPFINWLGNLAPGASASMVLQFTNPTKAGITYATRELAGNGGR